VSTPESRALFLLPSPFFDEPFSLPLLGAGLSVEPGRFFFDCDSNNCRRLAKPASFSFRSRCSGTHSSQLRQDRASAQYKEPAQIVESGDRRSAGG